MGYIFSLIMFCVLISIAYLVIHLAVRNGMIDAYHKIEEEKKDKTRRLYDEK